MSRAAQSAWAERLREYQKINNVLANSGLRRATQEPRYTSSLFAVPEFLDQTTACQWYAALRDVIREYGACIGRSVKSPDDPAPTRYTAAQFFRGPCTCKYHYEGAKRHQSYSYRNGNDAGPPVLSLIEDPLAEKKTLRTRGDFPRMPKRTIPGMSRAPCRCILYVSFTVQWISQRIT